MERALVERARHGDRDAFASLVHELSDRLYAVAYRILRDTGLAEDALQNALVAAWRQLPHLRDDGRFEAWLTRILVRICYETSRASRRASIHVVPIELAVEPTSADPAVSIAQRDQLERAFDRLPSEQRAILVLRHYLGLEPSEIAETLGIPAGTARSRLHYAHREMRAALEADARPAMAGGRPS